MSTSGFPLHSISKSGLTGGLNLFILMYFYSIESESSVAQLEQLRFKNISRSNRIYGICGMYSTGSDLRTMIFLGAARSESGIHFIPLGHYRCHFKVK